MSVAKLASGKWRVQIRRKTLKVDDVYATEAEARAAEAEALATRAEDGKGLTIRTLWGRYVDSLQFKQKATNTQSTERGRIQPVLEKLGNYTLADLEADPGPIYDYMDKRAKHISERTKKRISSPRASSPPPRSWATLKRPKTAACSRPSPSA